MDLDTIFQLMERAEQSAFTKVEVQQGDLRILLERGTFAHASMPDIAGTAPQVAAEPAEKDTVRAPISGVFYLCKEPGAAPFVQVGATINKGDTLCIIEAMKTMNEIRSPRSGVIAQIFCDDSATVAAGDTLFLLSEGN